MVTAHSSGVAEEGNQIRLFCDFDVSEKVYSEYGSSELESLKPERSIYSVIWYWSPLPPWEERRPGRKWPEKPEVGAEKVQIFRYRPIDPEDRRKMAWVHKIHGKFKIQVRAWFSL